MPCWIREKRSCSLLRQGWPRSRGKQGVLHGTACSRRFPRRQVTLVGCGVESALPKGQWLCEPSHGGVFTSVLFVHSFSGVPFRLNFPTTHSSSCESRMQKGYLLSISAVLPLIFTSWRLKNGLVSKKVRKEVRRTAFSFFQQPFMGSFPGKRDPLVF